MAEEYGMIDPYEPGQIKNVEGKRIVSYGTSSYGYDIRCADEFKLFTNINSTIVDPKEFDSKNFGEARRWWSRYLELDTGSEWARTATRGIAYIDLNTRKSAS